MGAGDFHVYPIVPQTREADQFVRTLGQNSKAVFLSEYGIGSLMNVIHEARMYEQARAPRDLEDFQLMRSMADSLIADWKRLGMEGVYPFPEDMLCDSQRRMAHRTLGFNLVRSNPNLCGFNVTGMLDHGMTGRNLALLARLEAWSHGCDAGWVVAAAVVPIRGYFTHNYTGRPFRVQAVLASEDVLRPGEYPARFRIVAPREMCGKSVP